MKESPGLFEPDLKAKYYTSKGKQTWTVSSKEAKTIDMPREEEERLK